MAVTVAPARAARRGWAHLALVLPAGAILLLFFVIPAGWALWTSLTDRALLGFGAQETRYIGLENFRRLWENPDFPKIVRNTVVFVIGAAVLGQTVVGYALALLLHRAQRERAWLAPVAYGAVLVAWITPPALAGAIWGQIFAFRHGALNAVLDALGLARVDMLADSPMLSVIVAESWRGAAFPTVIFLGALQTLPASIYEAAQLDGAGPWRRFRDLTLPLLGHLTAIVLLVTTITAMGSFLLIQILTNGDPGYQTETIALFAFHRAFVTYEIGFGAAIAVVMLALNLLFAAVYLRIARVGE
jgi:multiple sugar transport system permease protein